MKLNPSTVPTFASSRTRSRTISDRQSRPADDEGAGSGPQLIASPRRFTPRRVFHLPFVPVSNDEGQYCSPRGPNEKQIEYAGESGGTI